MASGSGSGSTGFGGGGGGFCSSNSFAMRGGISSTSFGSTAGVGIHGHTAPRKNVTPRIIASRRLNRCSSLALLVHGSRYSL
jgi:hypothetical protein